MELTMAAVFVVDRFQLVSIIPNEDENVLVFLNFKLFLL